MNGGSSLTGLSPAMFGIILGQMNDTVITELEDCPDTDVIEIVHLVCTTLNLPLTNVLCKLK